MPATIIKNFNGGLSLIDPKELQDNQFTVLKNFFYSKDKRIQTRRGMTVFGTPVPDSVVLHNACDATANFVATDDAANIGAGAAIRGSASVSFDITVAGSGNDFATVTNAAMTPANITSAKGYLGFWIKPPAGFNTNLTDVKVRLGSGAGDYYEWTLPTLTVAASNFIQLNYSDATTTGAPNDAAIVYFRIRATYTVAYTNKTGILIDDIRSYSATSTKPVTSYFFFQRDDTLVRNAICVAGTNMFHYNESNEAWDLIDSGLTEFETQTGMTTQRTRWDFDVYRNVVYMCNGVDDYRKWNEVTITTFPAQPKVRYIRYLDDGDRMAATGEDANPSTYYYTDPAPANADSINTNAIVVGGDQLGKATGIFNLAQAQLVGKSEKIYTIDVANEKALPIDATNGLYSHRATKNVGNAIVYYNPLGLDTLKQKGAATGTQAIQTDPLTGDLRPLLQEIVPNQYNANCGNYNKTLNNYYFTFDTNDDNIPDSTLVMTSLPGLGNAFTQYTYPNIYDYGYYIDADGNYHYLVTSANGGTIFDVETGFDDNGAAIDYELQTKEFDLDSPEIWKDFKRVYIEGFKSIGQPITVEVTVENEIVYSAEITDAYMDTSADPTTIGASPIGVLPIGGGASSNSSDIDIYPYNITLGGDIFSAGRTIQIRMYSSGTPIVWTLDRMTIGYDNNSVDIYPVANFA